MAILAYHEASLPVVRRWKFAGDKRTNFGERATGHGFR
jgi:hypothetical protein